MDNNDSNNVSYSVQRQMGGFKDRLKVMWQKRWFKFLSVLVGLFLVGWFFLWLLVIRNLPSADTLVDYQPQLPSMVRGIDGEIVDSFARERRVQLQYIDYPEQLIEAYLSAEDKTFFEHGGLDYPGLAGAVFDYVTKIGSGQRARGGSTITQQVAKNLLIGDEYSIDRKLKEALLAYRIEEALSKEEILELYLNEIFLGRSAYGVQAASRAYFAKDVGELELHEMAYLSILPKGPANYRPEVHMDKALERRNWVLGEMEDNGFIDQATMTTAQAMPLGTVARRNDDTKRVGGYFIEEVRRQLIEKYGEDAEDGPFGVYSGGLWVRTSLRTDMQEATTKALRDGFLRYARGKGWSGPINKIEIDDQWAQRFASTFIGIDYSDWRAAVVVSNSGNSVTIGCPNGDTGELPRGSALMAGKGGSAFNVMKPGDIIAVAPQGSRWTLRNIPEVSGGMVVQNPRNGRIYAMQGGFDSRISSFNRATQADRQPGSTIKPFVYAAALDQGMTPATKIVDGTFCVYQSAKLGRKCFRNFGGSRGAGAQTMRWGLEQSRNLMTVRAANDAGMQNVVATIDKMKIGKYNPYLAFALGAGDTTVTKLTNAYSMLVNHGQELEPTVIDYIQDRKGKVIFRADKRSCEDCNMANYDGKPMPRLKPVGKQLMDAMTAYQVVHMLEGVVLRGTAQNLRDLDRPLFAKTGTTTGPTNVWFVGGSPDVVAGVYMGYDQPRNMGGYAQGGSLAAPIFKQFARATLPKMPISQFRAPKGIRMVRIDRRSGRQVFGAWPGNDPKASIIWEAFKPETEPRRTIREEEIVEDKPKKRKAAAKVEPSTAKPKDDSDFLQDQGGIY